MLLGILISLTVATGTGPMHGALQATEAPPTLRAAFTVELSSRDARQTYQYDPRLPENRRWQLVSRQGNDPELDAVAANWSMEPSPDGRLFPDGLRARLGQTVEIDTENHTWRVGFRHHPDHNDSEFDRWAAERLEATAWLDPVGERFVRIDYTLPRSVRGPAGSRLTRYDQSYFLRTEPRWGFTYVSSFAIELHARAGLQRIRRRYEADIRNVSFFFASPQAEDLFLASRDHGG